MQIENIVRKIKNVKNPLLKCIFSAVITLVITVICSCASITGSNCPYVIDNPRIELGKRKNVCNFAGAYFTFCNTSEKTVKDFSVSFLVFDEDGESPLVGSNRIESEHTIRVDSNQCVEISVGLDKYFQTISESNYIIDYFYVKKINYTDGSFWSDMFGSYARNIENEISDDDFLEIDDGDF